VSSLVSSFQQSTAILVTSHPGQASTEELERLAAIGERPRKDYVELARLLGADVIDGHHIEAQGTWLSKLLVKYAGLPAGQVCEAFLRRKQYARICAWADRLGLPLALLYKLTRFRCSLVLVSVWFSSSKKAVFLRWLRVHSHLSAIVSPSSVQIEIAAGRLGVPRHKLHHFGQRVDTRFWRPGGPMENMICSVGWEARDYRTLVQAVRLVNVQVRVALGTVVLSSQEGGGDGAESPLDLEESGWANTPSFDSLRRTEGYQYYRHWAEELAKEGLPPNVTFFQQLIPTSLRDLYSKSRFVVIPLYDVDFDAGATAIAEAMAMGKALVLTRARGQVDFLRHGEHGLYVPPGDPLALQRAIEHLLHHPEEAERMGQAGRRLAEERHSLDSYIRRLAELIAHQ
jgi:glycosyltransferase involved in cell wall biosynthesis